MVLRTKKNPGLIPYQTVRKAIGWLGILLPAAMIIGNLIFSTCNSIQSSISHYYYTITGHWFVGILCATAMFLISYTGYNQVDNIVSSVAGFAALLIAFFPTNMVKEVPVTIINEGCLLFSLPENGIRNTVHYVSSGIFFVALAYMSFFLFTKSKGEKTEEKKIRNKIFKTSGVIIIVSLVLIALYGFFGESGDRLSELKPVFWLEWIALFAFGISWLVKGETVLKDHSLTNE
ncbi:MAG: hypothetical protein ABR503_14195 [Chitinophagaceae bacterium]